MNHEYRNEENRANTPGLATPYPDTLVVEQDGYQFSVLKNKQKGIKISAILGNRMLNSAAVKGIKKEFKPYGRARYNKKPSYLEFFYRPKNVDDGRDMGHAVDLLISIFREYHIQTTEDCVLCGLGGSDSGIERIAGRVYPAHNSCIQRKKQDKKVTKESKSKKAKTPKEPRESRESREVLEVREIREPNATRKASPSLGQRVSSPPPSLAPALAQSPAPPPPPKESYLLGLLGGLLGGILCSIPFILAYGFFSKFWVWLLALIPMGAGLGYFIMSGKRSRGGQLLVLVLTLLCMASSVLIASYQAPYHFNYQSFKDAKKVLDREITLEAAEEKNPYIQDYATAYGATFSNLGTPGKPAFSEYKSKFTPKQFWTQGFFSKLLSPSIYYNRVEEIGLIFLFTLLGLSIALPRVGKKKKTPEELWEENAGTYVPAATALDPGRRPKISGVPSATLNPLDLPPSVPEASSSAPAPTLEADPTLVLDRTPISGEFLFDNQPDPDFDHKPPPVSKTYEELFADILDD